MISAPVAKLVDAQDLKSWDPLPGRAGSIPARGTNRNQSRSYEGGGMKILGFATLLLAFASSANAAPKFSVPARLPSGGLALMNEIDANSYCRNMGGHLPTVREWAEYAAANGAQGIRETSLPNNNWKDPRITAEMNQMLKDLYFPVFRRWYEGGGEGQAYIGVDFYFNIYGFHGQSDDLVGIYFTASTDLNADPRVTDSLRWYFAVSPTDKAGNLVKYQTWTMADVRCALPQ